MFWPGVPFDEYVGAGADRLIDELSIGVSDGTMVSGRHQQRQDRLRRVGGDVDR